VKGGEGRTKKSPNRRLQRKGEKKERLQTSREKGRQETKRKKKGKAKRTESYNTASENRCWRRPEPSCSERKTMRHGGKGKGKGKGKGPHLLICNGLRRTNCSGSCRKATSQPKVKRVRG